VQVKSDLSRIANSTSVDRKPRKKHCWHGFVKGPTTELTGMFKKIWLDMAV
jgi:hypothetical protein